jgi:hypothetical protein
LAGADRPTVVPGDGAGQFARAEQRDAAAHRTMPPADAWR